MIYNGDNSYINGKYIPMAKNLMTKSFKNVDESLIEDGIRYSIQKRLNVKEAEIYNDYTKVSIKSNTAEIADFLEQKKPILGSYGVMFQKHGYTPNILTNVITKFLSERDAHKKERKKYPKGSDMFQYYDLMQLLSKIDVNSLYGVQGMAKSIFYNMYIAASITSMGQSLISASGLFFEMFLHNNVKFESLEDLMCMIHNILSEKNDRTYNDVVVLDRDVDVDECFEKLIYTCGFDWIPNDRELNIIYDMLNNLDQEDINRIHYKNNLYEFLDNSHVRNIIIDIMTTCQSPMIFPTDPPEEIKDSLKELLNLITEYVYYEHQLINRLDRYSNMIRSVSIITDTDSCIISLDNWYRYILKMVENVNVPLRYTETDELSAIEGEPITRTTTVKTDNSDEALAAQRAIKPDIISPQEGLRYTIINMLAYILDDLINKYVFNFVNSMNGMEGRIDSCLMLMKNEFLFKRVLVKAMKKNYAAIQELQEGTIVPPAKSLDIKGLAIKKSDLSINTRNRLQHILKEYILDIREDELSQTKIIDELNKFQDEIYQSLISGSKEYYKPAKIKSISSYDKPFSIQGIKASYVYNIIKNPHETSINLDEGNFINIVKVDINKKNIDKIKDIDEKIYIKLKELIDKNPAFSKGITNIAVPEDATLPEWVLSYIDHRTIISDNLGNFPIEDLGISRPNNNVAYTNIISFN